VKQRRPWRAVVVRPAAPMTSDINVTPLVDVVLVLLIIFMVVAPLQERDLPVDVPQTERVPAEAQVPQDQVIIRIDAQNKIFVNDEETAPGEVVNRARERLGRMAAGKKIVFFLAEDRSSFKVLVGAFDAALDAGAESVAFATTTPEEAATPAAEPAAPPGTAPGTAPPARP
jgi:biopolymer transport protein ExbD